MKRKKAKNEFEEPKKNTQTEDSDLEVKSESMSPNDSDVSDLSCEEARGDITGLENVSSENTNSENNCSKPVGFRVLIPINSQDSALCALEAAMARKWPEDTQFMLTTVIEGLSGDSLEAKVIHRDVLLAEQNEHRRAMRTWLTRLKDSFVQVFPNTLANLECGRIAEKICELACNWGADYIMIGSHDFNLIDRTALGSIASKVLMSAPCTVEAVRLHKLKKLAQSSNNDTENIRQLASQSPRRIIVATDFSKQADAAIQWIADSSWFDNTEIRLVTVTEASKREPGVAFLAGSKGYISEQQYQRTLEDRLRGFGREIAKKQPRCKLEVFVLQSDSVPGAILELVSAWDADLVVVGAQGAGSTDEAKAGSTALPIMDCLDCSAIAIRNNNDRKQVHFSWYPELQNPEHRELRVAGKIEAKKS